MISGFHRQIVDLINSTYLIALLSNSHLINSCIVYTNAKNKDLSRIVLLFYSLIFLVY